MPTSERSQRGIREWVLVNCGSPFTIDTVEKEFISPTPVSQPRQALPHRCTDHSPEPATNKELALTGVTELNIAPEPELDDATDQVCEPTTPCDTVEVLVEIEDLVGSPTHTPTTEGELQLGYEHYYYDEELLNLFQLDLIGLERLFSLPLNLHCPLRLLSLFWFRPALQHLLGLR